MKRCVVLGNDCNETYGSLLVVIFGELLPMSRRLGEHLRVLAQLGPGRVDSTLACLY